MYIYTYLIFLVKFQLAVVKLKIKTNKKTRSNCIQTQIKEGISHETADAFDGVVFHPCGLKSFMKPVGNMSAQCCGLMEKFTL